MKITKKVWSEYFQKIVAGTKMYEVRLADFACKPGDVLVLREWDPKTKKYTGRQLEKKVTYVSKTKNFPFWSKEEVGKYGYQVIGLEKKKGVDYIGVGVGAAIFNSEGKLFLMLRGKESQNERGKWEIPGGTVEFGERVEDAVKREIKEEFGIEIEVLELFDVVNHLIHAEKQHWVSPAFICKIVKGKPKSMEPGKCEKFGWFSMEETEKLALSLTTQLNILVLRKKYPKGVSRYA